MGEVVAWGLGLGLGWTVRNMLTSRWRIILFVAASFLLGCLITILSGEIWQEPWLILFDAGQVAVAALLGAYGLPHIVRWLSGFIRTA